MIVSLSERFLKAAICEQTEVIATSQGYEVTLPQVYASGNVVAVTVAAEAGGFVVHDNSYAAMLLERSGTVRAASLTREVAAGVEAYGCEVVNMRVVRRCSTLDEVAISLTLVGCASRLIADQELAVDRAPLFDFKAKLLGKVTGLIGADRIEPNRDVTGHLGSRYKIAFAVLSQSNGRPIAFVEPIADPSALPRKFKEFYDISLNESYAGIERVAVLDDSKTFPPGDALLMQEVGSLVRFSDAANMVSQWATVQ